MQLSDEQKRLMVEYDRAVKALETADIPALEAYAAAEPDFPNSAMPYMETRWFSEAIVCGSIETINWMIENGAELHFEDDEGYGALDRACHRRKDDMEAVIDLLVTFGADVNQPDCIGVTPLHNAAASGNLLTVVKLLAVGADPTILCRDRIPSTPLEYAQRHSKNAAVIFALEEAMLLRGQSMPAQNPSSD